MRSFFGSILLILVLAALGATIYYHWSTNSHLEFELRNPDEPEKTTQVINMEKRASWFFSSMALSSVSVHTAFTRPMER